MPSAARWTLQYLGIALAGLAALAFASYWHIFVYSITIIYGSPAALRNAQVDLGRTLLFRGTLAPGQFRTFYGDPEGDGTLSVSFDSAEGRVHRGLDYVTSGLSEHYFVKISSASDITYEVQRNW